MVKKKELEVENEEEREAFRSNYGSLPLDCRSLGYGMAAGVFERYFRNGT